MAIRTPVLVYCALFDCNNLFCSVMPECRAPGVDPFLCTGWRGRRKHVDRVDSVYLTKVHKVLACQERECNVEELNAKEFWLDHYQGQPYQQDTFKCICDVGAIV
jgi:hypothetical protein